jgi:type I restriction-modification system DNA methylase subunit
MKNKTNNYILNIQDMSSSSNRFLSDAVDELLTYYTPKEIIDFIKSEDMKFIIANPPFNVKS